MCTQAWEIQSTSPDLRESRSNFRLELTGFAGRSAERCVDGALPNAIETIVLGMRADREPR